MPRDSALAPVIAHRGASGSAPENTLAALDLAADLGAKAVEIDVNASADGVPFLHHDDSLERCTDGSGLLHEHDAKDLDRLHVNLMPGFSDERLPRLTAAIRLIVSRGLALNLEIKPPKGRAAETTEAICRVIETEWPEAASLVFSSFDPQALEYAHQRLPDVPRALLTDAIPENWSDAMAAIDAINLHCSVAGFDPERAEQIRRAGHRVYCYTANDDLVAARLLREGADGVFTDWPGRLIDHLAQQD